MADKPDEMIDSHSRTEAFRVDQAKRHALSDIPFALPPSKKHSMEAMAKFTIDFVDGKVGPRGE